MEVGLSYTVNSVYQLGGANLFGRDGVRIYEITNHLNSAFYSNNVEPLNTRCLELNTSPMLLVTGLKPTPSQSSYKPANPGVEESRRILESLKSIPIYTEVLALKGKSSKVSFQGNQISPTLAKLPKMNSVNLNNQEQVLPKLRCTEEIFYEKEFEKPGFGSPLVHSTAQSYSLHYNSNSESSYPLYDEGIPVKSSYGEMYKSTGTQPSLLKTHNSFIENAEVRTYKPVIVAEGSKTILPPGYIQVQKSNDCNRRTKIVTECEHVNRKHYAKGLCSTCYHREGRTKLAWRCEHKDKLHYAKGCCQECYLLFHSKRGKNKLKRMTMRSNESMTGNIQVNGNDRFTSKAHF